ncbi:PdxA family protein [Candidatus Omnitrophota bacterium]
MKKKVLITMGDPRGIGPYITVHSLLAVGPKKAEFTIVGNPALLSQIKGSARLLSQVKVVDPVARRHDLESESSRAGRLSLQYLREAVRILRGRKRAALVTAPVSKEAIQSIAPRFSGHTEFLAEAFDVDDFVMFMVGVKLKIAFLTRHVNIRDVSRSFNFSDAKNTLATLERSLKTLFKKKKPLIALCSLNPHAGIDTYLEKEERLLVRAKNSLTSRGGSTFVGPYPCDSLFRQARDGRFDALVVFCHDQGMIPFRCFEFSSGVNLTLGLPFIRTSPAHGPAFDLVDTPSQIDCRPMTEAIQLALKLTK